MQRITMQAQPLLSSSSSLLVLEPLSGVVSAGEASDYL